MNRVAANLAPLLTCPSFWPWHGLGAVVCLPAFLYAWSPADPDMGAWVAALLLPAWSAIVVTSLQKDILVSPVSFCLPGHRDVLRRTSLLVGIVASLVASLPILTYPGLGGLSLLWAIWSAFCFGLIVYVAGVSCQFLVYHVMTLMGPAMVVCCLLIEFPTARSFVQEVALFSPTWNTLVLAGVAMFAWKKTGSVDLARRSCGSRFLSLQMAWRRSATEEFGERKKRESMSRGTWGVRRWLLRQFFARIGRQPALSFRRYLAAMHYELAGHLVPLRVGSVALVVLSALVFLVAAGYAPPRESRSQALVATEANIVYMASCLLCMYLPIPMFTTMLLPAGRRERFFNALAIALGGGLIILATSLFLYVVLLGMDRLAPPLSIGGELLLFRPAELKHAFVPLVVLPMALLLKLVCRKWLLVPTMLLFFSVCMVIVRGDAFLRSLSASTIIVLVSSSWAILVGVLYAYSFHRDLVRE